MTDYPSPELPEFIKQIRAESRGLPYRPPKKKKNKDIPKPPDPEEARYLFKVYTGNRWMELGGREPAAKMLFGEFWYQHELCFLFANTNIGKSVLAVQIGDAIARGQKTGPFACEVQGAKVLYADFELSNLQFHRRYSVQDNEYDFNDNFLRAEFDPVAHIDHNLSASNAPNDEWLIAGLEYRIRQLKSTVLIIDNIRCLSDGTGNAAAALRVVNLLNYLRATYKLSILVLAHTPKRRNQAMPLTADDLNGSKMLINFADSAFTIGVNNADNNQRYIKQIKQRSTQQVYGEDNIVLCRMEKPSNFLQFRFDGNSTEHLQLRNAAALEREKLAEQISQLAAEGRTQRQISEQLGISLGKVNKLLNR